MSRNDILATKIELPIIGMVFATVFICLKISFLPDIINQLFKIVSIFLILISKGGSAFPDNKRLWSVVFYCLCITVSTWAAHTSYLNVAYALVSGLGVLALFVGFSCQVKKYGRNKLAAGVFWPLLIISFCNDATIMLSGIHFSDTEYLLGNKFIAGYLHLTLLTLYYALITRKHGTLIYNRGIYVLLFVESIYILIIADAMTCILSIILMFILSFMPKSVMAKISSGWIMVAILVTVTIIYFGTGMLLQNPFVANFVQNVLGRSLTLTGRTPIYAVLGQLFSKSPLVGYGYGNNAIALVVGWGNAQNGIWQFLINYGILGTISFCLMIATSLPNTISDNGYAKATSCGFLGFILASLSEISFGAIFMSFLALFSALDANYERQAENKQSM